MEVFLSTNFVFMFFANSFKFTKYSKQFISSHHFLCLLKSKTFSRDGSCKNSFFLQWSIMSTKRIISFYAKSITLKRGSKLEWSHSNKMKGNNPARSLKGKKEATAPASTWETVNAEQNGSRGTLRRVRKRPKPKRQREKEEASKSSIRWKSVIKETLYWNRRNDSSALWKLLWLSE